MKSSVKKLLIPLALTQFIASFAGSNMNVAINSIAQDLGTTVQGVQTAITLFLLTMAAFMIVGSKLTDIWGRKRCLLLGLLIYGAGTLLAAVAQNLGLLIIGYSLFEGIGSALMIPPVYILTTVFFTDLTARAKSFGTISGMGGIGAATGPLIGGFITTAVTWRASFLLQTLIVATILLLARKIPESKIEQEPQRFDFKGAILSALAMFFSVIGILQIGTNNILALTMIIVGFSFLVWFFSYIKKEEKLGKKPLLSTSLFKNKTSNLGMITQNLQWLMLMGISFVVSVYLQIVRGYSAIETGVIFTSATIGILISSVLAGRLAKKFAQKTLIWSGFGIAVLGILLLLLFVNSTSRVLSFFPGLFCIGIGVRVMLTASVNVVQSSFPENEQGEISGLSRSVSNLGSSMGTAIAGTILISATSLGNKSYGLALIVLGISGLAGLGVALMLPKNKPQEIPGSL